MAIDFNIGQIGKNNTQMGDVTNAEQTKSGSVKSTGSDKILTGASVKVTNGSMTDLEKLVAQIKNETDEKQTGVTKMRISSAMTLLQGMNRKMTEYEANTIEEILELDQESDGYEQELAELLSKYGISDGDSASVIMDMLIESLEKAVEQAVQDGKDHNEKAQKAKEQRDADQAKLDELENAEVKDEAAIAAAKEALEASQAELDAANELVAGDEKTINAAKSALQEAKNDKSTMTQLQNSISAITGEKKSLMSKLDSTLLKMAAEIMKVHSETSQIKSNASTEKPEDDDIKEQRQEEQDPVVVIRNALKKIDQDILDDLDEQAELKA